MQHHPNPPASRVVEAHLTMERYGVPDDGPHWIAVTLSFDPADPWAVALSLHVGLVPVRWVFGRELLLDGLHEPAGEGDVVISPGLDDAGRAVAQVELRSPDGVLVGALPGRELHAFVDGVLDRVPVGAETEHLDVDALVDDLLRP